MRIVHNDIKPVEMSCIRQGETFRKLEGPDVYLKLSTGYCNLVSGEWYNYVSTLLVIRVETEVHVLKNA